MTEPAPAAWQADLELIADAARAAGAVALAHFGKDPEVWWKNGGHSPVSAADYAANRLLEERLRAARPAYGWLSEETDDDESRLHCSTVFVIDPIDGTRAFISGLETWCVCVAVVHEGRPVAAALVAPALNETYLATADGPATLNGAPINAALPGESQAIRVAAPADLVKAFGPALRNRLTRVSHIPSLAYRLALVAAGRIDATLVLKNAHDWDLAAADLILQRAGGRLVDSQGHDLLYNRQDVRHGFLLAGAAPLLPALLDGFRPV
ncbi:3'(2'),5'-bisphosphate nucleotidase CysQ [Allorhizobium undicola]|uniref:3'(2'),5'-bisphosphate nucleotidase CysQ n=1 Tax=Allorhizobium undicola TaxID=78527 RepID=UPI003D32A0DF